LKEAAAAQLHLMTPSFELVLPPPLTRPARVPAARSFKVSFAIRSLRFGGLLAPVFGASVGFLRLFIGFSRGC
jgi:hypothetical protein